MRYRNRTTGVVVDVRDDKQMGRGWEPDGAAPQDTSDGYDGMTVDELKDEIRSRNTDRDDESRLLLTGTKADLVDQLTNDDSGR